MALAAPEYRAEEKSLRHPSSQCSAHAITQHFVPKENIRPYTWTHRTIVACPSGSRDASVADRCVLSLRL